MPSLLLQFMLPVLKSPSAPTQPERAFFAPLSDVSAAATGVSAASSGPGDGFFSAAFSHFIGWVAADSPMAVAVAFDMMKLAVPSLVVWLLGFYSLFHCYMNVLAEVLRFADRSFYQDW